MYILISIIVLLVIAILLFFVKGKKRTENMSVLASLAFAFVLAGIIFGDDRLIGYSLMGIGVLLAVIDIFIKFRKIRKKR